MKPSPNIANGKLKAYEKMVRVIRSCKTLSQLNSADNMLTHFINLYDDDNVYTKALSNQWMRKLDEIAPF